MVYVVLRTGKVLQYNSATAIVVEGDCITLRSDNEKYLVARIPVAVVERAEFNPPCRILHARQKPKRRTY